MHPNDGIEVCSLMETKVKDLIEDVSALSSPEYLKSIEEARNDYREGGVRYFEELFDVDANGTGRHSQ